MFPFIFHDIIDHLPSFVTYKILREILELVMSYPFRKKWLGTLRELCHAFHQTMLTHFPDRIIPKVHFVSEYGNIIYEFGPAVRLWCFRYESHHMYFKKIVTKTSNFRNISKTLVTRYRLKQAYKLNSLYNVKDCQYPVGIKRISTSNTRFNKSMKDVLLQHFDYIDINNDLYQCRKLINGNIEYRQSSVYIVDLTISHEQPVFVQVAFIIRKNEKWWLLTEILDTNSYCENLSAWKIETTGRYLMMDPNELKYFHKGLDIYCIDGLSYVSFVSRLTLY